MVQAPPKPEPKPREVTTRSPRERLGISDEAAERVKAKAFEWLKEVFELAGDGLLPGVKLTKAMCPISNTLRAAGFEDVLVGYTYLSYRPAELNLATIKLPAFVGRFPRWFDWGVYPELELKVNAIGQPI